MKSGSAMKGDKSGGAAAAGGSEQVKAVQQALKDKGHDPGEIDGVMGPKTQAALRDYQQKEGLKATGRLDSATASKLGVQAKADTSSSTSPAASPSGSSSTGASSSSSPSGSSSSATSPSGSSSSSTPSSSSAPSGSGGSSSTGAKPPTK
jgi:peptidoglycan hydrolase-like protein with peptidoglycan-binding domain